MVKVLVIAPRNPKANKLIDNKFVESLHQLICWHDISIYEECREFASEPTDCTPWSKVCRIRNHILNEIFWEQKEYTHLLWIDGDIVSFPNDLIDKLLEANDSGVSAPMVLVEGTTGFYDRSAFIIKGTSEIEPNNRSFLPGRNLNFGHPYWITPPKDNIVEMDSVGCCLLVHTDIYLAGAKYEDHPAFTDHYPICKKAIEIGRKVTVRRDTLVYHANLPKYGEKWH